MACSRRPAAGFSLLEVLVSVIVLGVGLLGTAGLLLGSLRSASESAAFGAAVDLTRDLSEKLRNQPQLAARNHAANPYLLALGADDAVPDADPACVGDRACTAAQLAAWDLHEWASRVRAALPEARLVVCFDDAFASGDEDAWACSGSGRTLALKLGWAPRIGRGVEAEGRARAPQLVLQVVPGRGEDGHVPLGF